MRSDESEELQIAGNGESPDQSFVIALQRALALTRDARHREALAAAQALVAAMPRNRDALHLLALNQRCSGQLTQALATLERLERTHPGFSLLYEERGHCHLALAEREHAIGAFARAVAVNPARAPCWSMLERLHSEAGRTGPAAEAAQELRKLRELPPAIVQAGSCFSDGDLAAAERVLHSYLASTGPHVEAARLLGRIAQRRGVLDEAEERLHEALALRPGYRAAQLDLVRVLIERQKYGPARDRIEAALQLDADNAEATSLLATCLAGLGENDAAVAIYRRLLAQRPQWHHLHLLLGHSLQALGRQAEAIDSFHAATSAPAGYGDAYWSLANLKTYRFSDAEFERMRAAEAAANTLAFDRTHLCFALGKALEDRGAYAASWRYYKRGNDLQRAQSRYRPEAVESNTREQIAVCDAPFFAARAGAGAQAPDPIFVVGLPRSGSTLVEQILASHSRVDGTQELYDVTRVVLELQGRGADPLHPRYPRVLAALPQEEFERLGRRYLADTRAYRKDREFFVDKMPNNFRHLGLIHLMLPQARIIDVRREPMACCFSNLKQLYASGQGFSYGIEEVARYYHSYLELMRHWDRVLPGRVLRVMYEDLVEDLEGGVRRLLGHCRLAFEPACLEFHRTRRAVSTASSEQVRQPISREGLAHWRHYEPWLGGLRRALGDAVEGYRL